ncbi:MAG: HEPN domain-containing protein [Pirellulales bacterium]
MSDRAKDIRLFERIAGQRLTAAGLLLQHHFFLESVYLAGYSVECAMKALILRRTPGSKHETMMDRLTKVGAKGHDFEYLKKLLKDCRCSFPSSVAEKLQVVTWWSTDLRYQVGTVAPADAQTFMNATQQIWKWARED